MTEKKYNKKLDKDFIKKMKTKKQTMTIPFTEEDLEDLKEGKTFNWSFPTDQGEWIDVIIINEEN